MDYITVDFEETVCKILDGILLAQNMAKDEKTKGKQLSGSK
jgi:hypothetical protein